MRLIIISIFLFLYSFTSVKTVQFTTNDINTFQLQDEINTSGDIDQTLLFINFNAPSNYEFVFADGIITSAESNDIFKQLTNHIPSSAADILQVDKNVIISIDTNDDILFTPVGTGDVIALLGTIDNTTHFGVHDSNNVSVMDVFGDGRVGIGTTSPNAPLDITANTPGVVGGFASGAVHITSPLTSVFANAVITGHNSFGGNKQLWYLGSASSSSDDITIINRQTGSLSLSTANTTRLKVEADGDIAIGSSFFWDAAGAILTIGNIKTTGNTISTSTGDLDITTASGGVFKFTDNAFQSGLDAVEFVEVGHGGGNGFINAVGDGGLDLRFEGSTLATFTDFGHLHLLTDVDQKHTLKIKTANNANETGIAWENSGGSFTHTIFREDVGANRADLIFAVGLNSDIDLLTNSFKIHGSVANEGKLEVIGAFQLSSYPNTRDDGTPINILGTDASGNLISGPNEVIHIGGNFVDTNDQDITNAGTPQPATFSTITLIDDISHVLDSSVFTINTDGVYKIIVAPQLMQGAGSATVEFWIRKNGTDIANSGVQETIGASSQSLPLLRWKERFVADDTFEIIWASNSENTKLDNIISSYGGPNIPSIMLSISHGGG